jgi:hypothetical protein
VSVVVSDTSPLHKPALAQVGKIAASLGIRAEAQLSRFLAERRRW